VSRRHRIKRTAVQDAVSVAAWILSGIAFFTVAGFAIKGMALILR
jgi:hypothetical protein